MVKCEGNCQNILRTVLKYFENSIKNIENSVKI